MVGITRFKKKKPSEPSTQVLDNINVAAPKHEGIQPAGDALPLAPPIPFDQVFAGFESRPGTAASASHFDMSNMRVFDLEEGEDEAAFGETGACDDEGDEQTFLAENEWEQDSNFYGEHGTLSTEAESEESGHQKQHDQVEAEQGTTTSIEGHASSVAMPANEAALETSDTCIKVSSTAGPLSAMLRFRKQQQQQDQQQQQQLEEQRLKPATHLSEIQENAHSAEKETTLNEYSRPTQHFELNNESATCTGDSFPANEQTDASFVEEQLQHESVNETLQDDTMEATVEQVEETTYAAIYIDNSVDIAPATLQNSNEDHQASDSNIHENVPSIEATIAAPEKDSSMQETEVCPATETTGAKEPRHEETQLENVETTFVVPESNREFQAPFAAQFPPSTATSESKKIEIEQVSFVQAVSSNMTFTATSKLPSKGQGPVMSSRVINNSSVAPISVSQMNTHNSALFTPLEQSSDTERHTTIQATAAPAVATLAPVTGPHPRQTPFTAVGSLEFFVAPSNCAKTIINLPSRSGTGPFIHRPCPTEQSGPKKPPQQMHRPPMKQNVAAQQSFAQQNRAASPRPIKLSASVTPKMLQDAQHAMKHNVAMQQPFAQQKRATLPTPMPPPATVMPRPTANSLKKLQDAQHSMKQDIATQQLFVHQKRATSPTPMPHPATVTPRSTVHSLKQRQDAHHSMKQHITTQQPFGHQQNRTTSPNPIPPSVTVTPLPPTNLLKQVQNVQDSQTLRVSHPSGNDNGSGDSANTMATPRFQERLSNINPQRSANTTHNAEDQVDEATYQMIAHVSPVPTVHTSANKNDKMMVADSEEKESFDGLIANFLMDIRDIKDMLDNSDVAMLDMEVEFAEVYNEALHIQGKMIDLVEEIDTAEAFTQHAIASAREWV